MKRMGAALYDNPVALMLGGVALGVLAGLMLPVSRFESQRMRPIADDLKDRAREAGQEAMRRGSEVLKETIEAGRRSMAQSDLSGGTGHGLQQANQNLGPGQ